MSSSGAKSIARAAGFTLLEVILAVLIMSMLVFSVYSFVEVNLQGITFAKKINSDRQSMVALTNYLQEQLNDIAPRGQSVLLGNSHKFTDFSSDEIEWTCGPGSGVMTTSAESRYRVVLTIQPVEKGSTAQEIGLRRQSVFASDEKNYEWVSLLRDVVALEIRYHDPRQRTQWLEKWRDPNARPSLVRVRIWRTADEPPYEAILNVPAANVQG